MRRQQQEMVETARRASAIPGLARARRADARPALHALRNIDRQAALARHPPRARARGTRVFDHLAAALTAGTGSLEREKSLRLPHAAGAAAHRAGLRLGAGPGAGARTGFAGDRNRNLDFGGLAEGGFLQRDFHVLAQGGTPLAPAAPGLPGPAEQVFENIGE